MTEPLKLKPYADNRGNKIITTLRMSKARIRFSGRNNTLVIRDDARIGSLSVKFDGDNGYIEIGGNPEVGLGRWSLRVSTNSTVNIGNNVTSTRTCFVSALEGTTVTIGDDVMIASDVQVRSDDAHAIYDVNTLDRINPSEDITIQNHVWLAWGVLVTGGVTIGEGSVVGARSIVTKNLPNNCLAVGTPAALIRRDIAWERPHLSTTKPHFRPHAKHIEKNLTYWNETNHN